MRSAILLSITERCAYEVLPQASLAAWAASRARFTSSAFERGTSQNGLPVTGETFSKYSPLTGSRHLPPMKFW